MSHSSFSSGSLHQRMLLGLLGSSCTGGAERVMGIGRKLADRAMLCGWRHLRGNRPKRNPNFRWADRHLVGLSQAAS